MTSIPGGFHGRYQLIDLRSGTASRPRLDARVLRAYIGGCGLGTWLAIRHGSPHHEPSSPEAPLVFAFSPLVGSPITTSAKFAVVGRSPLTGRINDSLAGSHFAIAGKGTGVDAIVLFGRAPGPSILVLDNGVARIEPADDLWGTPCSVAERILRERLGPGFQLAVIGPAGERQVRYATISHDGRHAGRGGSGAILGAKNLKAIAVRGTKRCAWARGDALVRYAKELSERSFGPATAKYRELGTAANLLAFNRLVTLPTRNFQRGSMPTAHRLAPQQLTIARGKTRSGCAACTIGCAHIYPLDDAADSGAGVRIEYESLFALGPLCGIDDPAAVLAACRECDELGLDTISCGGTIAFAMECVERGLLREPWLRFGDGDAVLRAIREIAGGSSVGSLLALGSREMASRLPGNAIDFAPQVKGLEIPGYEPRGAQTMALGFAVGTRGADHNRSSAYEIDFSEKVDRRHASLESVPLAIETEDRAAIMDSLILCKFLRGVFDDFFAEAAWMLSLVTGWDVSDCELRETAARIINAKKYFNIQAGWHPLEDTLPKRYLTEPVQDDAQAVLRGDSLAAMVKEYNLRRGWSPEGWLPPEWRP